MTKEILTICALLFSALMLALVAVGIYFLLFAIDVVSSVAVILVAGAS